MKPATNVNFKKLVKALLKEMPLERVAVECHVGSHIISRIEKGVTKKVEHSCGQWLLYLYMTHFKKEFEG